MGASRESHKISIWWKYGGKTFKEKLNNLTLHLNYLTYKWNRQMFIKDNITQPFYKHIGCKLVGHNYRYDSEDREYVCMKCWKRVKEDDYSILVRKQKIQKIKSKI